MFLNVNLLMVAEIISTFVPCFNHKQKKDD